MPNDVEIIPPPSTEGKSYIVTAPSGKKYKVSGPSQEYVKESKNPFPLFTKQDGKANILGNIANAGFDSATMPLDMADTLARRIDQGTPAMTSNFNQLFNRQPNQPTMFGKASNFLKSAKESLRESGNLPKSTGVLGNVVEGAFEAPATVGTFLGLQGTGLGAVGAGATMGALGAGPEAGAPEVVAKAGLGALLPVATKGLSAITPTMKQPVLNALSKGIRYGGSFGLGAGAALLGGAEPDEVVSQGILGVIQADHSKSSAAEKWASAKTGKAWKQAILSANEPTLRLNALKSLKALNESQADYFGKKIKQAEDIFEIAQKAAPEESTRLKQQYQVKIAEVNNELKSFTESTEQSSYGLIDKLKKTSEQNKKSLLSSKVRNEMNRQAEEAATNLRFTAELQTLDESLNKAKQSGALKFQENLPTLFRSKSDQFDTRQDSVFDELGPVKQSDAYNLFKDALDEVISSEAAVGRPYQGMLKIVESLKPSTGDSYTGQDKMLTPQQFKALKTQVKRLTGGKNFVDNISYYILNKKFGDFIVSRTGGEQSDWRPMNNAFSDVVEGMNAARKHFATEKGLFDTDAAERTLGKIASGEYKKSGSLMRLKQFVESGTPEYPGGLGQVFDEYIALGNKKNLTEQNKQSALQNIDRKYDAAKSQIETRLSDLENFVSSRKENLQKESAGSIKAKNALALERIEAIGQSLEADLSKLRGKVLDVSSRSNKAVEGVRQQQESQQVGRNINFDQKIKHLERQISRTNKLKKILIDSITAVSLFGSAKRIGISRAASAAKDTI